MKPKFVSPIGVIEDLTIADLKGARVTMINMPVREQVQANNPPLGPALLASRLQAYGVDVHIVDLNGYRIMDADAERRGLDYGRVLYEEEARELLRRTFDKIGDQDLIALSGLITTLKWQEMTARMVRELQPDTLLMSGGGLATEFRTNLFHWIAELDGVAHSEGDDVILKMAFDAKLVREKGLKKAVESGKLRPYYLGEHQGRPRFNYDGDRPKDLDALPFPAWDLLHEDVNGYRVLDAYIDQPVWGSVAVNSSATSFEMDRSLSTVSSRGCPFACKFCYREAQGERNYGIRSAENLTEEIVYLVETYATDFVGLIDDNFMVNPDRIEKLVPHMAPVVRDTGVSWGTLGRLDEAADLRPGRNGAEPIANNRRRVDDMAAAGCIYLGFGAESASARVLDFMGKGGFILSNGQVSINGYDFPRSMVQGIRNTREAGIHPNCTWIMGYPGETLEDLKVSVAFIKWQQEEALEGLTSGSPEYELTKAGVNKNMFTATAYPGTELFRDEGVRDHMADRFGVKFDKTTGDPLPDSNFKHYVSELNDATKVLCDENGHPLNFGAMSDDRFMEARAHVDAGDLFAILDM